MEKIKINSVKQSSIKLKELLIRVIPLKIVLKTLELRIKV